VLAELPLALFLLFRARLLTAVGPPRRYITEDDIREIYTHPVRQRLLREIGESGPTTRATLATAVGLSADDVDGHLGVLVGSGFVQPADDGVSHRDGPRWHTASQDLRMPDRRGLEPSARATFDAHLDAKMAAELELLTRMYKQRRHLDPWTRGSRGGLYLSIDELDAFLDDPGRRAIAVRCLAVPMDESSTRDAAEDDTP
jgi:hypothetical protein